MACGWHRKPTGAYFHHVDLKTTHVAISQDIAHIIVIQQNYMNFTEIQSTSKILVGNTHIDILVDIAEIAFSALNVHC